MKPVKIYFGTVRTVCGSGSVFGGGGGLGGGRSFGGRSLGGRSLGGRSRGGGRSLGGDSGSLGGGSLSGFGLCWLKITIDKLSWSKPTTSSGISEE